VLTALRRKTMHKVSGRSSTAPRHKEGVAENEGDLVSVDSDPEVVRSDMVDRSFELAVTHARKTRASELLSNRSASHARHVMLELFDLAIELKANISIVSGRLNNVCYGTELTNKLASAIAAGVKVEVIVTELTPEQVRAHEFGIKLIGAPGCAAYVSAGIIDISDAPHFCVVHGHGFRFETDKDSAEAALSFGRPAIAKTLEEMFAMLKSRCNKVI
jgi:hypothetical protein